VAVTTVYSVPDDGRKGRPKHVELLTPNKEHKKLHLVGIYMISITKMHGPMNIKCLVLLENPVKLRKIGRLSLNSRIILKVV